MVNDLSLGQQHKSVEELEDGVARLVDGEDDSQTGHGDPESWWGRAWREDWSGFDGLVICWFGGFRGRK